MNFPRNFNIFSLFGRRSQGYPEAEVLLGEQTSDIDLEVQNREIQIRNAITLLTNKIKQVRCNYYIFNGLGFASSTMNAAWGIYRLSQGDTNLVAEYSKEIFNGKSCNEAFPLSPDLGPGYQIENTRWFGQYDPSIPEPCKSVLAKTNDCMKLWIATLGSIPTAIYAVYNIWNGPAFPISLLKKDQARYDSVRRIAESFGLTQNEIEKHTCETLKDFLQKELTTLQSKTTSATAATGFSRTSSRVD